MNQKTIIAVIIIVFSFFACEQEEETEIKIDVCYSHFVNSPDSVIITTEKYAEAVRLFNTNQIDYNNVQFSGLAESSTGKYVGCFQFVNNLRLFTNDRVFVFDNEDKLIYINYDKVEEILLDNTPTTDNTIAILKYLDEFEKDTLFYLGRRGDKYEVLDDCLITEFGYFNLNSGTGNHELNFVKAWMIRPKSQLYPYAYVNDNTSEIIHYTNGNMYSR